MNLPSLGRFELASRVALDAATGSWFVLGTDDERGAALLGEELESLIEEPISVIQVTSRESLVRASQNHSIGVTVFSAPVPLRDLHLDDARSLLQREHAAVLVTPASELSRLLEIAPHFASWAGNRAFLVEEDRFLDDEAQEERLEALRDHYGLSDDDFLLGVEHNDFPLEPEHAEWLILLGRSDLLGGGR